MSQKISNKGGVAATPAAAKKAAKRSGSKLFRVSGVGTLEKLCKKLGVAFRARNFPDSFSTAHAWWEEPKLLVIEASSYSEAWGVAVDKGLSILQEKGLIEFVAGEDKITCNSSSCSHNTHYGWTLDYAIVKIKKRLWELRREKKLEVKK